ncbi:MAG: hypothetical protein VKP57_13175 [Candidatus Sericytochromatia bacterium]|nr:hypothetical protein [Candidatus Sericytochromatia bacterium]
MLPRLGVLAATLFLGCGPALAVASGPEPLRLLAACTLATGVEQPVLAALPMARPLVAWTDMEGLRLAQLRNPDPVPPAVTPPPSPQATLPVEGTVTGTLSASPTAGPSTSPAPSALTWDPVPVPAGLASASPGAFGFIGAADAPWLVSIRQIGRESIVAAHALRGDKAWILQRSPGVLDRLTTASRKTDGTVRLGAMWRVRLGSQRVALAARSWGTADLGRLRWIAHAGKVPEQPVLQALPDRWLALWRSTAPGRPDRILAASWQEGQALPLTVPIADGTPLLGPLPVEGSCPPLAGWQGPDPIGRQLHLRRVGDPGPRWHADLRTDLSPASQDRARVGTDGHGRLLVAWSQRVQPGLPGQALMARLHAEGGEATSAPILLDIATRDIVPLVLSAAGPRQWLAGWGRHEAEGWSLQVALLSGEAPR